MQIHSAMNANDDTYGLVTELSKHILQTYRRPFYRNAQFTDDYDVKTIKRLRIKAFEILLKKTDKRVLSQDYTECEAIDPIIEIQKHAFVMKLGLRHAYNATMLEHLLEELAEFSCLESSVCSALQLLVQLKDFNVTPEPITNIFYYGKSNPAIPEITYNANNAPSFQIYPMECFILSNKFEATLETQKHQIMQVIPTTVINKLHFLHGAIKSKGIIETESIGVSVAPNFMSNHVFDTMSSQTSIFSNQHFTKSLNLDPYTSQRMAYGGEDENEHTTCERRLVTSYLYSSFAPTETIIKENDSLVDTWKSSEYSVIDELNSTMNSWNCAWNQIDITDTSPLDHRTWEHFGELQPTKEPMFMTDLPTVAIHLAKIKQMNSLPLLSGKIMNSVLLLEEISSKEFINDVKSMLLGIESYTFNYTHMAGFTIRKNVSVYGVCSKSLEKTCQEAIKWGNCFKFLSYLVTPNSQSGKLLQEGLIFKAMCSNIKELLLYYQAALLRIFTCENKSNRLLKMFHTVRPVAILITKVAKLCEFYKENQCMHKKGNSILTRIYNEAIKVTDNRVALVFYSLLKSCCDVYFRFLQKWMFEGICDDIYGEFMIKTRPQYLRNRGHKFWTKSFSVCNEVVPGFLIGLTEAILQCGKTVRLLRICDSKNPVCHVCITEQPEVKVCLSVSTLYEQSLRCREYENKGKSALGPVLSLSTAILEQKDLERKTAEFVVCAQRNTMLRIREKWEDALKKVAQAKRDHLVNVKEQPSINNMQQKKKAENESSNKMCQIERNKQENETQENLRYIERTNVLNYYEDLANDIDKRCMRSHWRAKRMAFFDKRVNALTAANRDSQAQLKITDEIRSLIKFSSLAETPISFEDENENYSRTSHQTFIGTTSNAMIKSSVEIDQEDTRQSQCILENRAHITTSNNNEENDVRDFLNNQKLEVLNEKTLSKLPQNKNTTKTIIDTDTNHQLYIATPSGNMESDEVLEDLSIYKIDRTLAIERPSFLNIANNDNTAIKSQVSKYVWSLEGTMTPNNNQLDVQQIKFTSTTNDTTKMTVDHAKDTTVLNQRNDLVTPMSCTTDNFASSIQSPMSQTQNSEDRSPIEISNTDTHMLSSPRTYTKSPAGIKEDPTFSDLFVLARDESTTVSVTAPLTVADVEVIDHTSLQAYLEKSIRIPLNIQSCLVNNAVIKYFLKENNLLLHLHSLRSYFFLLNGEFAKSLTDSLYTRLYEISIPIELFNSATLTNLLERALVNSFNSVYVNSELLTLSARDTPTQLHISDPTALDCISLNYKISWPLNILLDDTVMQQYGKVFKFLITSGRVSWVLQEDFSIMKRDRKVVTSQQYHKLQLYRHAMTQFMNALHNYLTCSVLYASWTEFEKDLENSLTVDQIYLSHVNYIKRILSRCMLNTRGEKIRICLNNVFKVILKFHNRLRSQSWIMRSTGYIHPNFKKLEQMYRAFCELRAYMAHVAYKLAISGYQPHLMHFLNSLNINQMYDLTTKNYRGFIGQLEL
ncbi:gamma-tubulin complex component 6 isoform X2 [Colletes gigas]|uniref:gamma-tubulin complex component 6 isoform X2 n=1 Tax=Colletes gigas TaxID=935657 RepID=UPI001C9B0335|nr:gamma-tubulin complex component 6 isoform X2 [Colletes gigas]